MRVFAEAYREATGRTVIVDNKPGGGTTIGSLEVSRAKPDGNTVLYTTGGHTSSAVLIRKLPYDSIESFTPITLLVRSQGFGLMVSGKSPFRTLDQFLAAARAEPGKLNYGSSGIGNTTHLVGELFWRGATSSSCTFPTRPRLSRTRSWGRSTASSSHPPSSCSTSRPAHCGCWVSPALPAYRSSPMCRLSASLASRPTSRLVGILGTGQASGPDRRPALREPDEGRAREEV